MPSLLAGPDGTEDAICALDGLAPDLISSWYMEVPRCTHRRCLDSEGNCHGNCSSPRFGYVQSKIANTKANRDGDYVIRKLPPGCTEDDRIRLVKDRP